MVRSALNFNRQTHRNLIQPLSEYSHLKVMLASRYVRFHKSLVDSSKFTIRFLARLAEKDMRIVLGGTLEYLAKECNVSSVERLSPSLIKKNLVYCETTPGMDWKESVTREMLSARDNRIAVISFTKDEITDILAFACTS